MEIDHTKIFEISKPLFEIPVGENLCGIYFLMSGDKCVYIGQSINVYKRLGEHQVIVGKRGKFDNVRFLQVLTSNRDMIERYIIDYFRPPLNIDVFDMNTTWEELEKITQKFVDNNL